VRPGLHNQERMAPPQVTAIGAADIRSLSERELAELWVRLLKSGGATQLVLDEFNRRLWDRIECEAETCGRTSIPPPWPDR